jgi:hypothetical protein
MFIDDEAELFVESTASPPENRARTFMVHTGRIQGLP